MAEYKMVLPPMGEGVMEATITGWVKNEGDYINEDETIIEIATDKVDSDVPSPVSGKLIKKLKDVNDTCNIGEAFAILEVEGVSSEDSLEDKSITPSISESETINSDQIIKETVNELEKPLTKVLQDQDDIHAKDKFYSPLVKAICKEENITTEELGNIQGSGLNGRITKEDILTYVKSRAKSSQNSISNENNSFITTESVNNKSYPVHACAEDEVIEMDRMRKLIAENMLNSKRISPHVTSFVEADVTNIVLWRNKYKDIFYKKEGEKLTFTPIFIQAIVKAIKDFPMINISVEGNTIIKKKNINIGMATALSDGNLIVPVIKNANQLSLSGLAKTINDLANRARKNSLKPEDVKGGTYTLSNIGSFGNIAGTPIINQPEVAIMVVGSIVKKPAVIETPQGDLIGIRHKMILSHTYDHRVIDGALGGMFVKRVSDYLENFDINTEV
ncbi:dihydrolipoamide acetyltransferase family protein [Apibacter sp. HY039]|uniref:dihydrolipoamide acetyltransferase family protein n=1 Tax=Apibacter sp. HY039 TaxID=2501476 RepID=UPI000FEBC297|nr:dihydrolipoamide acetyltransferase family protein [Apibacter sp. HY039]